MSTYCQVFYFNTYLTKLAHILVDINSKYSLGVSVVIFEYLTSLHPGFDLIVNNGDANRKHEGRKDA